ncbi:hypothetical protein BDP81DRAFT_430756 [Colletotrichum phormii]|uniref:NADP-dependent mannitol dehydrogenase n=1 Tax=Colletotrichum phormii TaxID=359342 RepID=A0AAJ0ECR7_9PEZI|nr:uncharacterized protein BDP81DRAFT_430756 [Colletotrichum phormii]KAK1635077.1 hypothetical protein BDP81DRAFT_430756 [Colletotrichum phormii]
MTGSSDQNGNGTAAIPTNGTNDAPAYLSTLPPAGTDWKVSLKDKVIAISGANQGIGLGIAEVCLANDAACVYSLDITEPAEDFAGLLKRFPGKLAFQQCDVTDYAARAFIKLGCKGSIVFTASMTSYRPNRAAPSAPYGATKGAIRNMTHTLAMEWAEHGIRVNSISPGFVKTALTYYVATAPDWDTKMKYYGGMPRLALPQELGGAYVYLLSETASYTTGIDIPIAGIVGAW